MEDAFSNGKALPRLQCYCPIFQVDQQLTFPYKKEFVILLVFMPVVFAFDDADTDDAVVHLCQCLVKPFICACFYHFGDIDQLEVIEFYVQLCYVRELLFHSLKLTTPLRPGQKNQYLRAMSNNTPEQNFAALGLTLPPAAAPLGVYKPCLQDGHYLYVSGHGPLLEDTTLITGRVGQDLNADQGKTAARQVGLAILATVRAHLGSLDKVKRVIKTLGMVGCTSEFERHPYVINGCSELFAQVWGPDNGVGVRSAVGMGSLPGNIPVEVEVLFELH